MRALAVVLGAVLGVLLVVVGVGLEVGVGGALIVAGASLVGVCLFLVDTGEGTRP